MEQAAGLFLFPFSRHRHGNVRNLVKFFNIPDLRKFAKNRMFLRTRRDKIQYYVTGRENENGASRRSVSLSVFEISPRECSESCEIFNTRAFENLRKNQFLITGVKNFSIT